MKNFDIKKELEQAKEELKQSRINFEKTNYRANQTVQIAHEKMIAQVGVVQYLESKLDPDEKIETKETESKETA